MSWFETLLQYFCEDEVQEVSLHGLRSTHVICASRTRHEPPLFFDATTMKEAVQDFVFEQNLRLDPFCPSAGGNYDQARFRWHAILSPMCSDPVIFLLRRHRFHHLQLKDFEWVGSKDRTTLENELQRGNSLLVCGPTGSGKTSFVTALLSEHCHDERLVILEDLREIPLLSSSWISLVGQNQDVEGRGAITLFDLADEALRLRPDRIVLGELRTQTSMVFFETLQWGHKGSVTTLHTTDHTTVVSRIDELQERYRFHHIKKNRWDHVVCVSLARGDPPRVLSVERIREES